MIWPERFEPLWVKKAWKIAAVTVCVMVLGDALAFTVIVARNTAHFLSVEPSVGQAVLDSPDFDSANPNRGESTDHAGSLDTTTILWTAS